MDERERGAGALAFELGGAEGVGADDAHGGGAQGTRSGAVVPVGDRQVRVSGADITGKGDRLVEQGQAPDGPAAVEDPGGFPFDVGLGEDGFDDLAHLAVADHGVGVAVERQDRAVVGPGDALPAFDRFVARSAVGVEVDQGVDLGGDGVPVQPGKLAGLIPVTGVVVQDGAFLMPRHLADREHGLDVCWHDSFLSE